MTDITGTLALLRPYDAVGVSKVRMGAWGDCGYVMLDKVRAGQVLLSYGAGKNVSFDAALAMRGVTAHIFDHTVAGIGTTDPALDIQFHREGLGPEYDTKGPLGTLGGHAGAYGALNRDLLLKIDIEGAEWMALNATSRGVLNCFEQIVIEHHWLQCMKEAPGDALIGGVLAKLHRDFVPVHVHAHNDFPHVVIGGDLPVPQLLEVTWARRDLCEFVPSRERFPTPLDAPCVPGKPDLRLWFWPFLPE